MARIAPASLAAARHATRAGHWLWGVEVAAGLLACWLLLRSGLLFRLADAIETDRPRPWLASAACAAVMAAALTLIAGGLEASLQGVFQHTLLYVLIAVIVVPPVLALAQRSPRWWWAWTGAVAAILIFAQTWGPYAVASGPAHLPPAPPGPIRTSLLQLAQAAKLPVGQIYVSKGKWVDADVTGVPGRPRVVITQGMLEAASPQEARAAVGHLMGHYHYLDLLSFAGLRALLAVLGLLACALLFRPTAWLMGAPVRSPAEPAALPVLAAIAIVWLALCTPVRNSFIRLINVRADQYSLDHAREPDGLAQNLLRNWDGDDPDPSAMEEAVFYDHPSLKSRLLHAMTWKAARLPGGPAGG